MKKLVMVMCFALCASLAFAQTRHASLHGTAQKLAAKTALQKDVTGGDKGYTASIFSSKAGGDVIAMWDFSSDNNGYTVGNVGQNERAINQSGSSVLLTTHSQTNAHAQWQRIPDTTTATSNAYDSLTVEQGGYPALLGYIGYTFDYLMHSTTANNGFMLMTMIDNYTPMGGSGDESSFDSYIAFDPISTVNAQLVNFQWYQGYMAWYYDYCYIDYSVDGTTWYQYEINVSDVDAPIQSFIRGEKSVMLPAVCGGQATLNLRLRWECSNGGNAGYFWAVDDVKITEAVENSVDLLASKYYYGFYHQIPQGLDVPISWWASLQNTGVNNQPQTSIAINHLNANQSSSSEVANLTFGPFNSGVQVDTAISSLGAELYNSAWCYVIGDSLYPANTPAAKFPATTVGDNYIYPSVTSTNADPTYGDTILYMINALHEEHDITGQVAVWAQDNGILTPNAYCVDGITSDGQYASTGIGDSPASYTKPGYFMFNRYVTGANIPEGWAIRGMQLVAATQYSASDASQNITLTEGAKINSVLMSAGAHEFISANDVETGARTYTTSVADYNYWEAGENGTMTRIPRGTQNAAGNYVLNPDFPEYLMPGDYATINIEFPEQPLLEPNTSYLLGYQLGEGGYFAVASQSTRYIHHYTGDPDTSLYYVYFSSDTMLDGSPNALRKYGRYFGECNKQQHFSLDPDFSGWVTNVSGRTAMIRMLVGPRVTYPTFNVNIECEGYNGMTIPSGCGVLQPSVSTTVNLCGQPVEMTQGSTGSYVVGEAEPGYIVYEVLVDNVLVYAAGIEPTDPNVTNRTSDGYDLVYYSFENFTGAETTIKYIFAEEGTTHDDVYTLTVLSDDETMGTVSPSGDVDVPAGANVTISAIANTGYRFTNWNDNNTEATRVITVNGDITYTAYFEEEEQVNYYHIDVVPSDPTMGTTTGTGDYAEGSTASISAVPNNGYHFEMWLEDNNTNIARTVTVTEDATYTAKFAANADGETYYSVTVNAGNGGSAIGGTPSILEGSSITVIATADECYHFVAWMNGSTQVSTEASYTFNVTENTTLTATFAMDTYTISVSTPNTTMGTVSGGGEVNCGGNTTIVATANAGYHFVQWQDGNPQATRTISNVHADAQYIATFAQDAPQQGINEATSTVSMNLYPNPANGKVNLTIAGVNGNVNCTILDMSGRTVYSRTINAEETTSINIANLAKGAYFVRITNDEFTKVEKLVVR